MGNAGSGSGRADRKHGDETGLPSSPSKEEQAFVFDKKHRPSLVYQNSCEDEEPLYTKHKESSEFYYRKITTSGVQVEHLFISQVFSSEVDSPDAVPTGVPTGRHRSATVSEGAPIEGDDTPKVLPTVFKWDGGGKQVLISGTFSNWKSIPMVKSHGDFVTIIDLPEGEHQYKFLVDGEWKHDPSAKIVDDESGTNKNNLVSVKNSDFEVFQALDCDSQPSTQSTENDGYSQEMPVGKPWEKPSGPPILPPHLLQVILNQDTPISCEPTLLPEPNHVMLNHLYALSIKDGVMVLSATHRYRKKYVTTLLYKPI